MASPHLDLLAAALALCASAPPARAQPRAAPPPAGAPYAIVYAAPPAAAVRAAEPSGADGAPDAEVAAIQAAAARRAERAGAVSGSFPARARLAALLPRITAEYRHEEQSNRVVGLQGSGEVDYLRLAPGNTFLVRASWDLGRLVAAPGELQAAAQDAARARRRDEAVARATRLHFERQRLRVRLLLAPPAEALARAELELEIARLGAELDAVTGGAGVPR
ncbi:hypothetical protein [Anaeromyxobacter dehalogenans]|uniref:Outer membrane efflux protein n=1 Tax=Anaeromyxobacter dehalogenans (strain 2CP-C) TaxID=290397 RepID=Q2INK0_ANADE|nr:hypothetical protein [Anaeromyxobacter dehalogenans]ABC80383.1 hypothetical protein Adeh_0607 [Anaeromyxobacter dehalogenans 2CP-C]